MFAPRSAQVVFLYGAVLPGAVGFARTLRGGYAQGRAEMRRGHGTFRRETDLQRGWGIDVSTRGIDVNTRRDEIRWGAATSIAFGSFGWMIGVTIPPWLPGTNFVPSLLFSLAMGAFGFIPGDIAGKTVAATRIRRV